MRILHLKTKRMNKKTFKYIKKNFLKLTKKTYPYGAEPDLKDEGLLLDFLQEDQFGNYYHKIGESRTIFASHLDTVGSIQEDVVHVIDEKQVVRTDGHTILGADCKAGVVLMYWMIKHKIPGLYYFFIGEEVGCQGSGYVATSLRSEIEGNYDRIISFDRKDVNSIITFQSGYRTCSEEFSKALSKQLNKTNGFKYKSDNTGSYTDSAEFTSIVPECTNLSVGYYAQHTNSERQDLIHLTKLADSLLTVDWESLPSVRDTKKKESKWGSGRNYTYQRGSYGNYDRYNYGNTGDDCGYFNPPGSYPPESNSFEEEEAEYEYVYDHETRVVKRKKKKKTRRAGVRHSGRKPQSAGQGEMLYANGPKRGRRFISSGSELVELIDEPVNPKPHKGEFDSVREKLLLTNVTKQEVSNIKEQYLEASLTNTNSDFKKIVKYYGEDHVDL